MKKVKQKRIFNMKKMIIIGVIFLVFLSIGIVYASQYYSFSTSVPTDSQPKIIAGVIRPDINGNWYILSNPTHSSIGLSSVSQTETYIQVNHAYKCSKVISSAITEDETLASKDYHLGASVGLRNTFVYLYDSQNNLVNPKNITYSASNIWFFVICY